MGSLVKQSEQRRAELQSELDALRSQDERNELGQFATPSALAEDILRYASVLLPKGSVRFLDPAFGTGAFYSALLKGFPKKRVHDAVGFEIDLHYGAPTRDLWKHTPLRLRLEDFTRTAPEGRFNLLICNPPYVRHHHLGSEEKARLQSALPRPARRRSEDWPDFIVILWDYLMLGWTMMRYRVG